MSGTTAISSFSMIEAEFLEPKFMLKHMRQLCDTALDFSEYLVPSDGDVETDDNNIQELLKPDSEFVEMYRDFDEELKLHLKHFKGDDSNYINIRAVHRALFGAYNDVGALQSGINPLLYLANVLVLAEQMIVSSRSDKGMWDRLRQLDDVFPGQFVHSFASGVSTTAIGNSALLEATFSLALELRTQLAILSLEQSSSDLDFNPEEALAGLFLNSEASLNDAGVIRGWQIPALGGDGSTLPRAFQQKIAERYNLLRTLLHIDSQSTNNDEGIDVGRLLGEFPWDGVVLQVLNWVRLRREELSALIGVIGGPTAIIANVKKAIAEPQPAPEERRPTTAPRDSPRKKRLSFGRHRRRSGRKFDPNAPIDPRAIDTLKMRERDSGVYFAPQDPQPDPFIEVAAEEEGAEEDNPQQVVAEQPEAEEETLNVEAQKQLSGQLDHFENDTWAPTLGEDEQPLGDATLVAGVNEFVDADMIAPSGPPKSTQETLAALKSIQPMGKENRKGARFVDRQVGAQRVDFGDGFESSQPTPGPSRQPLDKGKQRADPPPSVSRKRAREEEDDDDDDDTFQAADRSAQVQERRQRAPVSKKARLDPPSPAPPSHQPIRASKPHELTNEQLRLPPNRQGVSASAPAVNDQEDSVSETEEAPEMTEAVPPRSTYQAQVQLAKQNSAIGGAGRARQPRRTWSADQEGAFIEYMDRCQGSYKKIQDYDRTEDGYGLLEEFTQVNLKDKARSMAINMIK